MSKKLIGAQKPFTMLLGITRGNSDPSKGLAGNPTVVRSTFRSQNFVEVGGRGPDTNARTDSAPGTSTRSGLVTYTVLGVPVRGSGDVTVSSNNFRGPTSVRVGEHLFTSGQDFDVAADTQATGNFTVVATPSVADLTINGVVLSAAAGARTSGSDNYDGTLGTVALIAADIIAAINDTANSFSDIVTASSGGGAIVTLTADSTSFPGAAGNAITLATSDAADVTRSGALLTLGVSNTDGTATNLAAAIDMVPGYSASALLSVVSVIGPSGPIGNQISFYAEGFSPANFTFATDGTLEGAEPRIGPPVIG